MRRILARAGIVGLLVSMALASGLVASVSDSKAATQIKAAVGGGRSGISVDLFLPNTIQVAQGDSIQWNNPYEEGHTVSFLSGLAIPANPNAPTGGTTYDGTSVISSGILEKGANYTVTFTRTGRYEFLCLRHRSQVGVVVVLPPSTATPNQGEMDAEAQLMLDNAVAAGVAAAAAVPAPSRTANADGTATWSIPNSPVVPLSKGQADVMQFLPPKLTVAAGDTVVWNNTTSTPHTVTFTSGGNPRGPGDVVKPSQGYDGTGYYNSGTMGTTPTFTGGTQFSLTFTKAGTYSYICILHANQGMAGVIEVTAPGVRPPSTGDAGLIQPNQSDSLLFVWLPLAMLAAAAIAGSAGVRLIRRP